MMAFFPGWAWNPLFIDIKISNFYEKNPQIKQTRLFQMLNVDIWHVT